LGGEKGDSPLLAQKWRPQKKKKGGSVDERRRWQHLGLRKVKQGRECPGEGKMPQTLFAKKDGKIWVEEALKREKSFHEKGVFLEEGGGGGIRNVWWERVKKKKPRHRKRRRKGGDRRGIQFLENLKSRGFKGPETLLKKKRNRGGEGEDAARGKGREIKVCANVNR